MRLRAENSALQTNIGEMKHKFDSELQLLRSAFDGVDITDSDPRCDPHPLIDPPHLPARQ